MRLRQVCAGAAMIGLLAGCAAGGSGAPEVGSTPSTAASSSPVEIKSERRDVAYVDDDSDVHKLDLFMPQGQGNGPFPLVIWVHGGGWAAGDKSDIERDDIKMNETKNLMLTKGYAVAAPNYRVLPDTKFPEPMQDVAASVRYLRAQAPELGLDPNRFALMGDSAGAHLAAMTAMTPKNRELQGDLGQTGVDASVKAFVGYYGIYDLTKRTEDQKAQCDGGKPGAESSHGRLVGADPDSPEGEKVAAKASPVSYVAADSPPALLFQGKEDCTAPPMQAERYHAALQQAGVKTELTVIDKSHGDPQFFEDPALHEQLITFLDATVKG